MRNIGSIAGNFMLKHNHNDFPSDVFTLLEAANAQLGVMDTAGALIFMSPLDFLQNSMTNKIVLFITLPSLTDSFKFL